MVGTGWDPVEKGPFKIPTYPTKHYIVPSIQYSPMIFSNYIPNYIYELDSRIPLTVKIDLGIFAELENISVKE
jgi:hypothetical protein